MTHTGYRILRMLVLVLVAGMLLHLPPRIARQDVVWSTYRALVEVDALARQHYIDSVNGSALVDGAIRGMMLQLDPYSGYLSPSELPPFERRSSGHYVGIGAEIGERDGKLVVIAPQENGPAARAGLRPGDVVLSIDGRGTTGRSVFDVEEWFLGESGTLAELLVLQPGNDEPVSMQIRRSPVENRSVRGRRLGSSRPEDFILDGKPHAAYLRISRFNEDTAASVAEALQFIETAGVQGLVIDLRFNPGGLIEQAVAVADLFLDGGVIVSTVTRNQVVRNYTAQAESPARNWNLVVLVNGSTASAAEVLAGALQDHDRAVLVGERTFGKGSVQRLIHLESLPAAIKLTYAYYRLPSGRIIHRGSGWNQEDWGIKPDVLVSSRSAASLLPGETPEQPTDSESASGALGEASTTNDPQLRAALAVLRGELSPVRTARRTEP